MTDPAGHITETTYDSADNLLTLKAASATYTFGYDPLKRKVSLLYPDNSHENYGYDFVGNLTTYRNRAGNVRTSIYDERDREVETSWNDAITSSVSKSYDSAGRLLTLINDSSCLSYTYDDASHLASETQQNLKEAPMSVLYTYDADGRRQSMADPSGSGQAYEYTGRGQLKAIRDLMDAGGIASVLGDPTLVSPVVAYTHDWNGNRINRGLENGTVTVNGYDDANRMLSVDHRQGGTSYARFDYAYNADGNRTSRQSTIDNQASIDRYVYDPIDQVTTVKYNFNAAANTQDRRVVYSYDERGNRISVRVDNNVPTSYTADNLNRYTSIGGDTPGYDANGNLTSQGDWSYTYDAQNRLTSALSTLYAVSFIYDGRNRCISRTVNEVTWNYYYDGWDLIEEQVPGNKLSNRYVHGARADELLRRTGDDGTVYYHQDALGSTVALTDSSGSPVERYKYDIFGTPSFLDSSSQPLELFIRWKPFPLYWPRIPDRGQTLRLPQPNLLARFGKIFAERSDRVRGRGSQPVSVCQQ